MTLGDARTLTSEELTAAINRLAQDIVRANVHWQMRQDLAKAMEDWPLVERESNTFWSLTFEAHETSAVVAVCRVYDHEKSSLHLPSLLQLIQANLQLFEKGEFLRRMGNNPFADSLAESARQPDPAQLAADIASCSDKDPIVNKLLRLRGAGIAHRSLKVSLRNLPVEGLTVDEVELLLKRARDILNRYSGLFSAETYSVQIVGGDDYKTLFQNAHDALEKKRTDTL